MKAVYLYWRIHFQITWDTEVVYRRLQLLSKLTLLSGLHIVVAERSRADKVDVPVPAFSQDSITSIQQYCAKYWMNELFFLLISIVSCGTTSEQKPRVGGKSLSCANSRAMHLRRAAEDM